MPNSHRDINGSCCCSSTVSTSLHGLLTRGNCFSGVGSVPQHQHPLSSKAPSPSACRSAGAGGRGFAGGLGMCLPQGAAAVWHPLTHWDQHPLTYWDQHSLTHWDQPERILFIFPQHNVLDCKKTNGKNEIPPWVFLVIFGYFALLSLSRWLMAPSSLPGPHPWLGAGSGAAPGRERQG